MITEDYVSFETAKLLKEKGFPQEYDVYHSMVYNEEDYENEYEVQRMVLQTQLVKAGTLSSYPVGVPEPKCYCPTLQMAMKWLREVHNLHIMVNCIGKVNYDPIVQRFDGKDFEIEGVEVSTTRHINGKWENVRRGFKTYEESCEAAIKYCLENLI